MQLYTIDTGYFKLDGGAMFGVVPKSIWNKINPADDKNLCNWAMRCLLVQEGKRLVLIDNGIGDKQDDKFFSHYYLSGDDSLSNSLRKHGFTEDDITDVFLTHLHFDHCGGSVKWNSNREGFEPVFKNATYWSHEKHWEWAVHPNAREKASFLKENILPIRESGQLKFIADNEVLFPGFSTLCMYGHTEAMMLPVIDTGKQKLVYCADLLPSAGHVPLPYVMAYDVRPLVTLDEKAKFLKKMEEQNYILFFEHDPEFECGTLTKTEKGIRVDKTFRLNEVL